MKNTKYKSINFFIYLLLNISFSANPGDLIITEIFYNRSGGHLPEYIELYNKTEEPIDLLEWKLEYGSGTLSFKSDIIDNTPINRNQFYPDGLYQDVSNEFTIDGKSYELIITDGQFRSAEPDITYCSKNNSHDIYNNCDSSTFVIFWKQGFNYGKIEEGNIIKIIDENNVVIDSVQYKQNNFPAVLDIEVTGKSMEFIVNPDNSNTESLNDLGENWKFSVNPHDLLFTGDSTNFGSPLNRNHINSNINIVNDTQYTSECDDQFSQSVCQPESDGYPGGNVYIKITGYAYDDNNFEDLNLDLDSLEVNIKYGNDLIDSFKSDVAIWYPDSIFKNISTTDQEYNISFTILESSNKIYGKSEKKLIIRQEENRPPTIESINNQSFSQFMEVFENTDTTLTILVKDEICNPCTYTDLYTDSSDAFNYNNSNPFLWTGNTTWLDNNYSNINIFSSYSIDSLNGLSANEYSDTLQYNFSASDPFGDSSETKINIIIKNLNQKPTFDKITPDQTMFEDDSLIIELQASDVDGDSLIFKAIGDDNIDSIIVEKNIITIFPKLNFNGNLSVTTKVYDFVSDSLDLNDESSFSISVLPKNDLPNEFSLITDLLSYNSGLIDTTSLSIDTTQAMYYRLAQDSLTYSIDTLSSTLLFKWEKNDSLDVDIIDELNTYKSDLFYRLEAVLSDSIYIILKDSIIHDSFLEDSLIHTRINLIDSFYYYIDSYESSINNEKVVLDTSGNSIYNWRVVAQNYSLDFYENDPFRISENPKDSTKFKIDLIKPTATDYDIIINDLISNYYDIIWYTSEPLLSDYTFLDIYEENNQFDSSEKLTPRQISPTSYHFTRPFPKGINTATLIFNLELRDRAMNSGFFQDSLTYLLLTPETFLEVESPSKKINLTFTQSTVLEPLNAIIIESDESSLNRYGSIYKVPNSPIISIRPMELLLQNKVLVSFELSKQILENFNPNELALYRIDNSNIYPIKTEFKNGKLLGQIERFGNYSIFFEDNNNSEIPSSFEIGLNYPNPFNGSTTIPIKLPYETFLEVSVYNLLGKEIAVLLEKTLLSGQYSLTWEGLDKFNQPSSSGIYFVVIKYNDKIYSQKIMLLK